MRTTTAKHPTDSNNQQAPGSTGRTEVSARGSSGTSRRPSLSQNPLNLALRLGLEVWALIAIGRWGWGCGGEQVLRAALMVGLPIGAATIWGTLRVPDDRSASGKAAVPIPGVVRLGIEFGTFAVAAWCLWDGGAPQDCGVFAAMVTLHYVASRGRVGWLLRQPKRRGQAESASVSDSLNTGPSRHQLGDILSLRMKKQ